jgi:hypothetical protein
LTFELLPLDAANVHGFNRINAMRPFLNVDEGPYALQSLVCNEALAYNSGERFSVPTPYSA